MADANGTPGVNAFTRSKHPPPPGEPTIQVWFEAMTLEKKLDVVSVNRSKKALSTGGKSCVVRGKQFELYGQREPQQRSSDMAAAASVCVTKPLRSESKCATARL
eukprot:scaffold56255_cov31-Tisochrysis_lutea.AAC.3